MAEAISSLGSEVREPSDDGYFVITRLHRDDIIALIRNGKLKGITEADVEKFTDDEMKWIANKMESDFLNQMYWESLEYFAQEIANDHTPTKKNKNQTTGEEDD